VRGILFAVPTLPDYLPNVPEAEMLSFGFELYESGWASLTILVGGRTFTIPAFGSMTDGLGDLVRAALQIATGGSHVGVLFDEEACARCRCHSP
jgi:hypothetical protein